MKYLYLISLIMLLSCKSFESLQKVSDEIGCKEFKNKGFYLQSRRSVECLRVLDGDSKRSEVTISNL